MTITVYRNPDCGTSRNTRAMIRQSGEEPAVIEYLRTPPSRETVVRLIGDVGLTLRAALRVKATPFEALGRGREGLSDEALLDAIEAHPILLNRPFVVTERGTRLCRSSEVVLEVVPNPAIGRFVKEDGTVLQPSRRLNKPTNQELIVSTTTNRRNYCGAGRTDNVPELPHAACAGSVDVYQSLETHLRARKWRWDSAPRNNSATFFT